MPDTVTEDEGKDSMDMVTFGMLIIDDIYFPIPQAAALNILGGAGTYAVWGARCFRPAPASQKIGWTVHVGNDFPGTVKKQIDSWNTYCNYIATPDRPTTRANNWYLENEVREFEYTSKKIRIDKTHLNERQLRSKTFHLICSATRAIELVSSILEERKIRANDSPERPMFVWEPVPMLATIEERELIVKAMAYVEVVSPNEQELAAIFGDLNDAKLTDEESRKRVVQRCDWLFERGFKGRTNCAIVVRRGERGCYVSTDSYHTWMPPYHGLGNPSEDDHTSPIKVIDPTGGGNTFLGGYCIGMLENTDPSQGWTRFERGAVFGNVAASFAIEQIGLPGLSFLDGKERWNETQVEERMVEYLKLAHVERIAK